MIVVVVVYILICLGCIWHYWTKRRSEFNWLLHGLLPAAGAVLFFFPLYYEYYKFPPTYPIKYANWVALGWIGVGIALTFFLVRPLSRPAARHGARLRRGRDRGRGGSEPRRVMAVAVDHRIGRDEIIWAFGPDLEPVLEVEPGDDGHLRDERLLLRADPSEDDHVTQIDFERVNSATGPVAVKGAEPGDSLVAEILDVRPIDVGFACLIPGFGQLIEQVGSPVTRLFKVQDGGSR